MLAESDRMRQHLDRLPLAYVELDARHRVLEWNPAAVRIFGYTKEEALGRVCSELILTDPIDDQVMSVIRRIEAGDMQAHNVNENRTKDGRTITCEWFNTPLIDSAGRFAGVISMAQDVTERNRVENANRQLAAIVESSDDAIISTNLDGLIASWNRGAERIYGYTADEVKGSPISILVPYNRTDEVAQFLSQIRQGKSIEHLQTVRRTKDGRLIDMSLCISPIRNASGIVTGASTIARDITTQRQAERRARESADLFQQLAANIEGYFWVNAPDESQMYYMSPGYERITGLRCATLYARPESWPEIVHPDDRAGVLEARKEANRVWGSRLEYRIVRPDGAIRWIRDRAFPVRNAAGHVYRVVGLGEDISDQKQAMDDLRESKKRVQALSHRLLGVREEERGRLARELHDGISQTLTSLALAFEAGISAPPRMRKAKLNAAREWLEKGLRHAREMANDLRPPMLDHLGPLAAVLWLIGRFNSKGLHVHFRHDGISGRLAPDVETVVYRLVEEALNNVLRHARVAEASVRIWIQDGVLNVQIEDEGVGFEPEAAFASAESAGLAGIREQVELSGGQLVITAGIGEGTSLLARWPIGSMPG